MKTLAIILTILGLILIGGFLVFVFIQNNNPANSSQSVSKTSETYNIQIMNFAFSLSTLTINNGNKVIWTNIDSASHTVTSDSGNEISSGTLLKGKSYSHTFNTPGTYNYHCSVHPNMKADIIVQ